MCLPRRSSPSQANSKLWAGTVHPHSIPAHGGAVRFTGLAASALPPSPPRPTGSMAPPILKAEHTLPFREPCESDLSAAALARCRAVARCRFHIDAEKTGTRGRRGTQRDSRPSACGERRHRTVSHTASKRTNSYATHRPSNRARSNGGRTINVKRVGAAWQPGVVCTGLPSTPERGREDRKHSGLTGSGLWSGLEAFPFCPGGDGISHRGLVVLDRWASVGRMFRCPRWAPDPGPGESEVK